MKFFRSIREGLKDPKKKSITMLIMYGIFFIIVFILIKMGENTNYNNIVIDDNKDYNFTYTIYNNDEIIKVGENEIYNYEIVKSIMDSSDSKTTYKDSNKVIYSVNLNKYFELTKEEIECVDCENISITLTEEDKSVMIDLSNYYESNYIIQIEYRDKVQ